MCIYLPTSDSKSLTHKIGPTEAQVLKSDSSVKDESLQPPIFSSSSGKSMDVRARQKWLETSAAS